MIQSNAQKYNQEAGYEKYNYIDQEVPRQGPTMDILDFEGITTTLWLRSKFSVDNRLTSISNYISPWENARVREIHTRGRLNSLKIDNKQRSTYTYIKHTEPPDVKDVKYTKCLQQYKKRMKWRSEVSTIII